MSFSPSSILDQGRNRTASIKSRPSWSRLECLMMDMVRSQMDVARSQEQIARSIEQMLDELSKSMGTLSSVERSLHGTPSPSPIPGRRSSSPSAETTNVSVPTTSGYLVPSSNTQLKTVAGGRTFRRGQGDIVSREVVSEGQDVVVETHIVEPEVRINLANHPLHPSKTRFRVAPEVEESIRREDVRKSQMSRTRIDTERRRSIMTCVQYDIFSVNVLDDYVSHRM